MQMMTNPESVRYHSRPARIIPKHAQRHLQRHPSEARCSWALGPGIHLQSSRSEMDLLIWIWFTASRASTAETGTRQKGNIANPVRGAFYGRNKKRRTTTSPNTTAEDSSSSNIIDADQQGQFVHLPVSRARQKHYRVSASSCEKKTDIGRWVDA